MRQHWSGICGEALGAQLRCRATPAYVCMALSVIHSAREEGRKERREGKREGRKVDVQSHRGIMEKAE